MRQQNAPVAVSGFIGGDVGRPELWCPSPGLWRPKHRELFAPTIVQHNGTTLTAGQNPTDLALNSPTSNGNLIVVIVAASTTGNLVNSISDAAANVYAKAIHTLPDGSFDIWYAKNTAAHAVNDVITIHFNQSDGGGEAWAQEIKGCDTDRPLGPTASGAAGSGTALTCTAVTLTSAPAIGIAAFISGNGSSVTGTGGWANLDPIGGSDEALSQIFTTTGSKQATATQGSSANWDGVSAYFYAPRGVRAKLLPLGI